MKQMTWCTILQTFVLTLGIHFTGATVNLTVIDGFVEKGVFECNSEITLRCRLNSTTGVVQWSIGNPIGQVPDANCFANVCANSAKFPGRYFYTYNQQAGISDLKIANASFDDNTSKYQCSDGNQNDVYNDAIIKAPPKSDTTSITVMYTTNYANATLKTGCIYPFSEINLVWYSSLENGSDVQTHDADKKSMPCSPVPNCIIANTSLESSIQIPTSTNGQARQYFVNISFGSVYFSKGVGKYNVTLDTTTLSTTNSRHTSASSLTSSTTETFRTTSVSGTDKTQNADDTSTIFIAVYSSLPVIFILLIVVFLVFFI